MKKSISEMNRSELNDFIFQKKEELGDEVCIIGYPGQFDDLLQFSDFIGGPEEIAKSANQIPADYLVFTGWRFFSDIACILAADKKVIQANLKNDCPLSERIEEEDIRNVFDIISGQLEKQQLAPIAYVAANFKIRSFCGENGGATCTPANALKVIEYYLSEKNPVLFIPANDAFNIITALDLPEDDIFVINKQTDLKSIPANKKLYAWNVECYVHSHYSVSDVMKLKHKFKQMKIIGHKECSADILQLCDYTCFIPEMYQILKNSPPNTSWGVGTVDTWVKRVAKEFPNKHIVSFRDDLVCEDMKITEPLDIANTLQSIVDYKAAAGALSNRITVPEKYHQFAIKALYKMFDICKRN